MSTLEMEAMLVVLAKRIEKLSREVKGGMTSKSDKSWLDELKRDAQRLNF